MCVHIAAVSRPVGCKSIDLTVAYSERREVVSNACFLCI